MTKCHMGAHADISVVRALDMRFFDSFAEGASVVL